MQELTILLVEDNDDDRFLTTRQLRKIPLPLKIDVAKNGEEALKQIFNRVEQDPASLPSLILLDLQLPKIGGIAFLEGIREKYSREELPVIILSSSDNPADIISCQNLGVTGYLSKPLDPLLLQKHIKDMANVSQQFQAAAVDRQTNI